jgi:betaine lipid synthase
MLALVAAQIKYQARAASSRRPVWVDFGGGTGFNIEAMSQHLDVPTFFEAIYLVDLSPSLLEVARDRFERLGWKNVVLVCEDACSFARRSEKADLITLSYSLSMLPNFTMMLDAFHDLASDQGLVGVVDFYVQSQGETIGRNYLGGSLYRHVNWFSRNFWRTWFEFDRVRLEGPRRVCF